MTYNCSEIMSFAWTLVRQELWSRRLPASELRNLFPDALRSAWREMKVRAEIAAERAKETLRPSADLRTEIENLENRDTLGFEGIERLSRLHAAYNEATRREAGEKARADMEAKRKLIASAGGRFCSVTFIKKDGSERVMRIQPATLQHHVRGDAATDAGKRATATRKARHPHLLPVWDVQAKAPRSVNLATVSRIAVDGRAHVYHA